MISLPQYKESNLNMTTLVCIKMFVPSKDNSVAPSFWISFQNLETILWKKENTPYTSRSNILSCLLWHLWQRNERGDLVANVKCSNLPENTCAASEEFLKKKKQWRSARTGV
jgi:hypothetical protein